MQWDKDAEQAVANEPFFVRKRVKKREEAETQGFTVKACFGQSGCPNRIDTGEDLSKRIEALLRAHNLKESMQGRVSGPLKPHHEFRVTLADCPNGCSRPQIVDIGLLSASLPKPGESPCSECEACLGACREGAITLAGSGPQFDWQRCLACGQCARICPTGAITQSLTGYRILLGGKLGRHPRLGRELSGIFSAETTLAIIETCLTHFKTENKQGERFGELLNRTGFGFLAPYTLKAA
jgi:dissimilatory sulfite reductase (desulfoviridin) alpha/beta subunit